MALFQVKEVFREHGWPQGKHGSFGRQAAAVPKPQVGQGHLLRSEWQPAADRGAGAALPFG